MKRSITYEHPLGERIRLLLRLEHLFRQAFYFHKSSHSSWESRALIETLFELLDLCGRNDLKSEVLKELERAVAYLQPLLANPQVDRRLLESTLITLQQMGESLQRLSNQLGGEIKEDPFLRTIASRSSIPGGTCDFDLPAYHQWLEQPIEVRQQRQEQWLTALAPLHQAVEWLLRLIRNSAEPLTVEAVGGQLQQMLDNHFNYQMIRLSLPPHLSHLYPEVSGSRHRFSVRFLTSSESGVVEVVQQPISFQLALCFL